MFDDINLPSNSLLHEGLLQPFTQIDYGGNHLRIAVDPSSYEEMKTKIARAVQLPLLYHTLRKICEELYGVETENISNTDICRKQIYKDLQREEVSVNGQSVIDLPQLRRQLLNKVDMKWMYNSQIQVFSRGNLASLAILRHLLTFLCRTEAGVENFNFSYN